MSYILGDYDKTLEDILLTGEKIPNRTGVDCLVKFGVTCQYDISEFFPVPTRRKYPFKSIIAELLWMLSGSTNVKDLEALNSKIWSAWRSEEFEKKNGYQEGQLGPIYGWNFRHYNGDYAAQSGGFDQITNVINELRTNKYSRRTMINLWNPEDMYSDRVRLPCCHYNIVFMVNSKDELIGVLNQRSSDFPIGVPANIIFYSALIYMIAQQTDLKPGKLFHNSVNSHIYENQIPAVLEYLNRPIFDCPKLSLKKRDSIFEYEINDFELSKFECGAKIVIPVEV